MALKVKTRGEWFFLATAIIIVIGFTFWQSDLTSDPPMYFSGIGQSLSTDPYMYSFHARNKILFGEFDPFEDPRWVVFKTSLVSYCSYLWLSLTDVSLKEANTVGLLLNLTGMFLILLGLAKYHRAWVTTAVALCYLMNVSLLTYGRLPYLENGLIFWAASTFLVWTRWGEKSWAVVLCGAVIALAVITGKIFGVLLLPALVLSILFSRGQRRWGDVLAAIVSFTGMTVILAWFLYGNQIPDALEFISHQSVGLHGYPDGFKSPWAFVEHLVSYGFENNLFYLNPDLLLFLVASGFLLSVQATTYERVRELPPTILFALFWILCNWMGLMPLNYSPLRYSLYFIPAFSVLCFATVDWLMRQKLQMEPGKREPVSRFPFSGWTLSTATLLFWILTFNVVMNALFPNDFSAPRKLVLWGSLAGGVSLALFCKYLTEKKLLPLSRRGLIVLTVGLLSISVVVNSFRIRRKHFLDHHFSVTEANRDLAQILGDDAVVTGPYAPALTFQTQHRSFIHFFGAAKPDSLLFDKYPITHVAVDLSSWRRATTDFPVLSSLQPMATYWIRDYRVHLFNVSKVFSNPGANAYRESPYERAMAYFRQEQSDSAVAALLTRPEMIYTSKAAGVLYSSLMHRKQQYQHVLRVMMALADRFPTDFSLHLECGHFLQQLALASDDRVMLAKAQQYFEQATILNPYRAEYANQLYGQTLRSMGNQQSGK